MPVVLQEIEASTTIRDIILWRAVASAAIDVEREKYNKAKGVFSSHISDRKKSMIADHTAQANTDPYEHRPI